MVVGHYPNPLFRILNRIGHIKHSIHPDEGHNLATVLNHFGITRHLNHRRSKLFQARNAGQRNRGLPADSQREEKQALTFALFLALLPVCQ